MTELGVSGLFIELIIDALVVIAAILARLVLHALGDADADVVGAVDLLQELTSTLNALESLEGAVVRRSDG